MKLAGVGEILSSENNFLEHGMYLTLRILRRNISSEISSIAALSSLNIYEVTDSEKK